MKGTRKNFFGIIALCAMITSMVFTTGCGTEVNESNGKIAVLCKAQGVQFWDDVKLGAEDAAEELGYDIVYMAPDNETDIDRQVEDFRNVIADKDVKAIVLAPIDTGNKLNEVIAEADAAGKPVIAIDSDVTSEIKKAYVGSDNISAGNVAGRKAKELLPEKGEVKIAIIGHNESSATAKDRIAGFNASVTDTVSTTEPYVDEDGIVQMKETLTDRIKIVETKYCGGSSDTAREQTKELLNKYPDLSMIYATNENSTTGVCQAIEDLGLKGKVMVVGFNASDTEQSYIKNGILTGTIIQNPYTMGYLGVRYSNTVAGNGYISSNVDTGVLFVTSDNINDDSVQLVMNPGTDK